MHHLLAAWSPDTFPQLIGAAAVWAFLGLILLIGGFKLFDWVLPTVDFSDALNKDNRAIGILLAGFFVAMAIIIHAAIA